MKKDLKVTLIQTDLHWEDPKKNLMMFSERIGSVEKTDLIILPEMFTTGFTMNTKSFGEGMNGRGLSWMQEKAAEKGCVITGSLIIAEDKKYYNRLIWMRPDGTYETYDKRHLFRMAGEHEHFSAGKKKTFVELNGWRILPLVCYDLRFPVWSRNKKAAVGKGQLTMDYDLLMYVANWPEKRINAWSSLLVARAIENQCYTIGVNRIGVDAKENTYNGASAIIDPKGNVLRKTADKETIETVTLSWQELNEFRQSFPAGMDADEFEIKT